jgi:hypothetical protein
MLLGWFLFLIETLPSPTPIIGAWDPDSLAYSTSNTTVAETFRRPQTACSAFREMPKPEAIGAAIVPVEVCRQAGCPSTRVLIFQPLVVIDIPECSRSCLT